MSPSPGRPKAGSVNLFAPPRVDVTRRSDGTQLAKSPDPLGK